MEKYGNNNVALTSVAFILLLLSLSLYLMPLIHAQTPEGHIVIDSLSASPNPAYANQSITISVTVRNKDAGISGADVYIVIIYRSVCVTSGTFRVDRGGTATWTDTRPASDPCYYSYGKATYEVRVYWNDRGNIRLQDVKKIEINVIPVKLISGAPSSPIHVNQGETFTITYEIQNYYGEPVNVGLGASICSGSTCYHDPANDKVVTISGGSSSTQTRKFQVPSNTAPGTYDLVLGLWSGAPGNSEPWEFKTFPGVIIVEPSTYTITFSASGLGSDASGTILIVDGRNYGYSSLPCSFNWEAGSTHSYTWYGVIQAGTGKQYVWAYCSGLASARSGSITVSGSGTITAYYDTFYYLTMQANPPNGGTVSPGSGWYKAGTQVQISATPSSGYIFQSWTGSGSGSYTGTNNPAWIIMNGPITEIANFKLTSYTVKILAPAPLEACKAGASITIDGVTYNFPNCNDISVSLSAGTHSIRANAPPGWIFHQWYDSPNAKVSDRYSPSTTLTVSGNGAIGFDFIQQQATTPSLSVQVSANPNSITTSQTSTIIVTVTSEGSAISGASVSLSCSPSGPSLNPSSGTTGSDGKFTATFSSSTAGTFTITATASKSGYNSGSGSTQVTVSQTPPPFDFSLSANPNNLSITLPSSGTASAASTIEVASINGFSSQVSLSASWVNNAPSGVTYSFSKNSVTPPSNGQDSSILTITVSSSASTGSFTLRITGTSGNLIHYADMTVTISPPQQDTGILSIDTTPVKGEVFVNGQSWGVAPQSRTVNVGTYIITFGPVSGYTTPSSQTVSVTKGQTTTVIGIYKPIITYTVDIIVKGPPTIKVDVYVDGSFKGSCGVSPMSLKFEEGTTHKIKLNAPEMEGYIKLALKLRGTGLTLTNFLSNANLIDDTKEIVVNGQLKIFVIYFSKEALSSLAKEIMQKIVREFMTPETYLKIANMIREGINEYSIVIDIPAELIGELGTPVELVFTFEQVASICAEAMENPGRAIEDINRFAGSSITSGITTIGCLIVAGAVGVPTGGAGAIPVGVACGIGGSVTGFLMDKLQPSITESLGSLSNRFINGIFLALMSALQKAKSVLGIQGACNITITIIDPKGRIAGASLEEMSIAKIPGAIYNNMSSHPQIIVIPDPLEGEYKILVVGRESGDFSLQILTVKEGLISSNKTYSDIIHVGEKKEFCLNVGASQQKGFSTNFAPILYSIKPAFPFSMVVGEKLLISINATDPEGIDRINIALLDSTSKWHNKTANYDGGVYWTEFDTQGFPVGYCKIYVSIIDGEKFISSYTYNLQILGKLVLTGKVSKSEVVSGEGLIVTLTLIDQYGNPVKFANVNVSLAGRVYSAVYSGGEQYIAVINDTRGLEGSYVIKAMASNPSYLPAEYELPLIIRPWWWPYLPYAYATVIASVAIILTSYAVYRSRRKKIIIIGSEDLLKVLKEANERLSKGDYAEAVKYSAETLRSRLLEKLGLSGSLTIDELVDKVVKLRKDIDSEKLRYVLKKGEECTFARYKPNKEEAEKVLKYSEELLSKL